MEVHDTVTRHYGRWGLEERILNAFTDAGVDIDALTVADLGSLDELHAGFLPATQYFLAQLDLTPNSRLLDVGCGIGGPARTAAAAYSCQVTGVDLTPEFITTAVALTERVGLAGRVNFENASGDDLPFAAGSFDRAVMLHVGMNIPDKGGVFTEVRRVLEPGGLFALFEQMRTSEGSLPYPLPWAQDESSSFVETLDEYVSHLTTAGFSVERTEDRTAEVGGPPPGVVRQGLGPQVLAGPDFVTWVQNNVAATRAGLLAPMVVLARAV